jgi:hypothetical protein
VVRSTTWSVAESGALGADGAAVVGLDAKGDCDKPPAKRTARLDAIVGKEKERPFENLRRLSRSEPAVAIAIDGVSMAAVELGEAPPIGECPLVESVIIAIVLETLLALDSPMSGSRQARRQRRCFRLPPAVALIGKRPPTFTPQTQPDSREIATGATIHQTLPRIVARRSTTWATGHRSSPARSTDRAAPVHDVGSPVLTSRQRSHANPRPLCLAPASPASGNRCGNQSSNVGTLEGWSPGSTQRIIG